MIFNEKLGSRENYSNASIIMIIRVANAFSMKFMRECLLSVYPFNVILLYCIVEEACLLGVNSGYTNVLESGYIKALYLFYCPIISTKKDIFV
jgi:hypothetical protein